MNPDHHIQSPQPTSASPYNLLCDHRRKHNNGDSHQRSREIHHPYHSKIEMVNNKQSEEEETGHMMGANKAIGPSAASYVITVNSCPSSFSTSTSAYSSPSPTNLTSGNGRHQSKELAPTFPTESDEFYAKNIGIASVLVMLYLIEVTVQVLLTIQCYHSFQQQLDLVADLTEVTSSWSWFLVISSVLSSFLVTLISIMWVFRGMDFSDRLCGRLLCYVMHSFLLGLLWRYLKLAFAYDKADLEEFFKLRTIQSYVQSLPLVTIHLTWILATQQQLFFTHYSIDSYHALSSWLVIAEMTSTVISLLILSSSTVSSLCNCTSDNNNLRDGVVTTPRSFTVTAFARANAGNQSTGNGNKLKVESGKGDNNPNHHFNDSGTALSVNNQQRSTEDENDTEGKKSCSSTACWLKKLMTIAIKWMMSHYSQKCEPGRALLLVSRVISLGMLAYKMNYYWTSFITLLHFAVSFAWLGWWAMIASGKSKSNIRPEPSSSSTALTYRGVNNDTSCDARSDGSSNDSGLVVKSEMENGIPVVSVSEDGNVDAGVEVVDNAGEGQKNVDCSTRAARGGTGYQIEHKTKGDHVMVSGFASCLSVVIYRRKKAGNGNNDKMLGNNGFHQKNKTPREVLLHVLPLTYVLFWDLTSSLSLGPVRNPIMLHGLSLWAPVFPVLLVAAENMFSTIYVYFWWNNEPNMSVLVFSNAACLIVGWLFVALRLIQLRSSKSQLHCKSTTANHKPEESTHEEEKDDDDADSGYGKNKATSCIGGGGGSSSRGDASMRSLNRSETDECLSFCCSSLSHPLNIKRKGRRDEQQDEHNFCKDSPKDKLSSMEHRPRDVSSVTAMCNEYEEQLGMLKRSQHLQFYNSACHDNKSNDDYSAKHIDSKINSTLRANDVSTNSTIFADHSITVLALPGVNADTREEDNHNCKSHSRPESMRSRYHADVKMAMTCETDSSPKSTTNFLTIREALTRKISNKSCGTSSLKKAHKKNNRPSQNRESVKGDGEEAAEEGKARVAISSFKSSSSPFTGTHQQQQRQQYQPTANNSNKCMPISIKSPISWLPETCCNDSNGSSNSRNTNTLVMPEPTTTTNGNRLFYCPEKNIDLRSTEETTEESKRPSRKHQPKQQRPDFHNEKAGHEGSPDFSIVFFDGRTGGGTSRSYKQKQSRTSVASNALLLRAARSANTTPVACSNPFPLDIKATTSEAVQQQQHHPHFRPSPRPHNHPQNGYGKYGDYDDDEVDPIERTTKEDGATHRRIRNQITGKTYLSDGASLTSLDGLCEIRASTPVEIKKASRVIVNYPPPHHKISDSKTVSRCLCKVDRSPSPNGVKSNRKQCGLSPLMFSGCEDDRNDHLAAARTSENSNNNNIYEKLIDDSYGILICEGENGSRQNPVNRKNCHSSKSQCNNNVNNEPHPYDHQIVQLSEATELRRTGGGASQKLRILCAKCLENHDPLLTNCVDPVNSVDDDHLPEVIDYYTNPSDVNGLATMLSRREQYDHMQKYFPQLVSHSPYIPCNSDTTDYPSDTEFTANNNAVEDDGQSMSTHFSSVTCTRPNFQHHNYHVHQQSSHQSQPKPTQLSQFIWAASTMLPTLRGCDDGVGTSQQQYPKEFTGLEYVRTWLMANHPRTFANHVKNSSGIYNTNAHQQHNAEQHQHTSDINEGGKTSIGSARRYTGHQGRNDKGLSLLSSATSKNNPNSLFKNKSACDKTISKKKRFRQLEKRQRPIGRGASPPAKELSTNFNGNTGVLNGINITTTTTPTSGVQTRCSSAVNTAAREDCGIDTSVSARFQPPPSRKQHPLLFYDMIPRQEQQKPLTATSHKKCRDQLDLFHKELETVV